MALITLRQLLDDAAERGYGVPAWPVSGMEELQAVMDAAAATDSPAIIQCPPQGGRHAGTHLLSHLVRGAAGHWTRVPVVLHQDHSSSMAACVRSIQCGFTSVMIDGSLLEDMETPASFEYNVDITRRVVDMGHAAGVSVEGEVGCLAALDKVFPDDTATPLLGMPLTDPGEAARFVHDTGVDALAVAVGTSHGAYRFPRERGGGLALKRIAAIQERVPDTHLVLHAASSMPAEWLKVAREFGGEVGDNDGVPLESLAAAVAHGIRKLDVEWDLKLAATAALRRYMAQNPRTLDPRKAQLAAVKAMVEVCKSHNDAYGASGRGSALQALTLDAMAARYGSGELEPRVPTTAP